MNEILLYKIIWKKVAICCAIENRDVYVVNKKFNIEGNKVCYIDDNKNIKLYINREELYSRLKSDGFKITEQINKEDKIINAKFSITRERILSIANNNKEKKIK